MPPEKKSHIFRQQALNRLSSPERLDTLMQVVSPTDWLPLTALAFFGILGVIWSIFGNIPITVTGKGVLINPRRVVQLQSPISGQLQSLNIRNSQCVKKDDILGIIDPSDKKQQLQQQRDKLAQLQQQVAKTTAVRQQRTQLETAAITAERTSLQQRLQDTQKLTPHIQKEGLNSISQQRRNLQQKLKDAQELTPLLQQRLTKQQSLQQQGAISSEQVLQAEQEYRQTRQNISEIQAQLQQLRVQSTELQQKHQENLNNITQINAELEKLDTRSKQLEQDNLEATNTENNQIQEIQQNIVRLQKEVVDNSIIKSPHTGCIVELTATRGQYLNPGSRLGTLQTTGEATDMKSVTYFAVEDGKKIRPGMEILITPDTVKRTRFGGIVGKITEVTPFPVTSEGANYVVGNPEVVKTIMGEAGGKIETMAQLKLDPKTVSGYKWSSSSGPELEISPGTTTTVRVTVEQRKPITFVLPILREWSGISGS
ncbi:NHLP bacteriocin system secretion protein [Nostoc sp. FACHB-87]|uniref:NHLP bacteriocin system secretion protein n=1 Tax=Nostocaceae TaxID=1162 RepID=UPI001685E8FC|nr:MULTISPECIES: NHLP bacteriocin system secretion protein [Nostocaceae]MBD2302224.1 NHLP bacteriocin system secretion protein [Nostoc sp. FACHB-190]MBD2459225.1 NHLP bacteriocin system secretion protein [Nostoc sp. FACHB-87]MBD2480232.1 NHLP bacteriocin system secretion protein [Anabaena sp. FACHB-83]